MIFSVGRLNKISIRFNATSAFSRVNRDMVARSAEKRDCTLGNIVFHSIIRGGGRVEEVVTPCADKGVVFRGNCTLHICIRADPVFGPGGSSKEFSIRLFTPLPFLRDRGRGVFGDRGLMNKFSFPVGCSVPRRFNVSLTPGCVSVSGGNSIGMPFSLGVFPQGAISDMALASMEAGGFLGFSKRLSRSSVLSVCHSRSKFLEVRGGGRGTFSVLSRASGLFRFSINSALVLTRSDLASEGIRGVIIRVQFGRLVKT